MWRKRTKLAVKLSSLDPRSIKSPEVLLEPITWEPYGMALCGWEMIPFCDQVKILLEPEVMMVVLYG